MEGWISIHRKIMKWEWYTDNVVKSLFIHCLLKANHTTKKWRGKTIKRGQFVTSLGSLSSETGLSVKQVRRALEALEMTGEVGKETTKLNTCITVVYYDEYQNEGKQKTIKGQTKGQTKGKQRATTNNDNNDNNELNNENKKRFIPPSLSEVKEYFDEKGYRSEVAIQAFEYYDSAQWKDSRGNKVKNWKQKMNGVWFKEENKKSNNFQNRVQPPVL